jgi:isochorismate synthase EntC
MHLVSDVEGQLREDLTALDALMAILPAGTLSGAPKVRAMELIDELEQPLETFDEKLFHEIVTDICINNRDEMTVTLLGGLKFIEQI